MAMIKIDDQEYEYDALSNEAKSNLHMLKICDQEMVRLNNELAIVQTARVAYANALKTNLPTPLETIQANESIKFS